MLQSWEGLTLLRIREGTTYKMLLILEFKDRKGKIYLSLPVTLLELVIPLP